MSDRAAKDALFDAFAEVAKALASGRRAEIADLLAQGERPVEEIAAEIGQSVANTSHHLRAMARAGLVMTRRDGTRISVVYYCLKGLCSCGSPEEEIVHSRRKRTEREERRAGLIP